jgi:dCTP deaminase
MKDLTDGGFLGDGRHPEAGYSSLDLTIGDEAYRLVRGTVKPNGPRYLHYLKQHRMISPLSQESDGGYTLQSRKSYLFRLRERISNLADSPIYGQATAKSSVGRMDVLARLIVDGMDEYEGFKPHRISSGDMFLEITPMTFDVRVLPNTSLTQLRLFMGAPRLSRIVGEELFGTVLFTEDSEPSDSLSVDLTTVQIAGNDVSAFSASARQRTKPLNLWEAKGAALPKPWNHWKFNRVDGTERLRIRKSEFYIIRSFEKIRLPGGVAVYCRASDETIGEMRIHYAGFVHPYFGRERTDNEKGTPLIFEVRGHDIDVSLRHREKMARLEFYRMSQDCKPAKTSTAKGRKIEKDAYGDQSLRLSKYFAPWPKSGTVSSGKFTPTRRRK